MVLDQDLLYRLVGQKIREARQRIPRLSQTRLAEKLAISRASVVNIEAGRQRAPLHLLWQIAGELGTELALLLPNQQEYLTEEAEPAHLDEATVAKIEAAVGDDPQAKLLLAKFVSSVRTQTGQGHE